MSLDNIHIPIREGRTLSIASINRKLEIAALGLDEFFVTKDYFKDWYEDVMPISDIKDLLNVIKKIMELEDEA